MLFKDIVGHQAIKQKLIAIINSERISHAQLFLGKEGSGNLAMALAYVQYLYCLNKTENDAVLRLINWFIQIFILFFL